ncbi:MAG: alpha-glucosidase [Flavobacteriaceae bacterium]|nr:alpha-glucosidase [Flavobacteriaceae bacterium]
MNRNWWKEGVVYQIYPRSFNDSNSDGLGDIKGIIDKLEYIKSLGVDMIWISPMYESPNVDNGYDVSDYRKISDDFGGDKDFDSLLKEIHSLGLRLIMDLIPNHSSDQHYWFQQARKSKKNPYHDYYIWKEGNINSLPNNWKSVFSGNAWEWNPNTKEYYLHYYTKKQPDLNWENEKVRKEIYSIIEYWLEKGVDGFRMDVISLISKSLSFKNISEDMSFSKVMEKVYANGPRVHEFLKEMNREVLSKYDIVTIGEGPGINLENGLNYVDASEKELNMIFHFDHLTIDFGKDGKYDPIPIDFIRFKEIFRLWDKVIGDKGWNSIFLGNHDFSRIVSRFGNDQKYHTESSKLLVTLLMTLRGTPYIYQGDEIGMTNAKYKSIDLYDDIETINAWKDAKRKGKNMKIFFKAVKLQSRDNARTPMQWDSSLNSGFSKVKPWIQVNKNYLSVNVATQENDSNSILNFYREMISFRKQNAGLIYGHYEDLDPNNNNFFVYKRWDSDSNFLIIHNFSNSIDFYEKINYKKYSLVISNYLLNKNYSKFNPWESKVFLLVS